VKVTIGFCISIFLSTLYFKMDTSTIIHITTVLTKLLAFHSSAYSL